MSEKKPFEPLKGSVVVGGKIRTAYVNIPKISFRKSEDVDAEIYSAEDILADQEIVDALVKSKSSVLKVVYDPNDKDATVPTAADTAKQDAAATEKPAADSK